MGEQQNNMYMIKMVILAIFYAFTSFWASIMCISEVCNQVVKKEFLYFRIANGFTAKFC